MNNKLQAAVEIAEEIEASLAPIITATQNEVESDTYLMCRGVHRQTRGLAQLLRNINKEYIMSDNQAFDELEGVACEIENLRTYVSLLVDTDKSLSGAELLSVALVAIFNIGKEIARIRGVEYS
ncbi:hypothetical protein KKJ09_20455 [Xenorhabdus bovienii]|uniref:Uncharacterized protein n=4 Tax=Xenorhabdus bovienii TaxID=40576 RepID=A0A077PNT3_XENBV|nr:hypothetical protein [Xenorhabdus bovienii]MDE1480745.1 hypothetical protein [Xenorhabdus bovienii]MDE9495884.1 hypothetical protein [Xenorhabdus bovienii]MDE9504306.1 hypothetical protein [Xenorhabdus bovienii]MDE9512492.1 hypothetical protein [Xenorhabdus bovienii]MDE9524122.1 hypothetical protein [Xenorhabdus bovienii]